MIFEFSQQYEIYRAPRAQVRARQIFFRIVKFVKKSHCNFFLFDHNSKRKFFRALWSLKNFFENSIFSKIFKISKIFEDFQKNFKIFTKKYNLQRPLQQSIQTIWKFWKYIKDAKFHEKDDALTIVGARAFSTRAHRIFYHMSQNFMKLHSVL